LLDAGAATITDTACTLFPSRFGKPYYTVASSFFALGIYVSLSVLRYSEQIDLPSKLGAQQQLFTLLKLKGSCDNTRKNKFDRNNLRLFSLY
jgi:hypothetical protein